MQMSGERGLLGRGNNKCKGPEASLCLVSERNSKEAPVTGAGGGR